MDVRNQGISTKEFSNGDGHGSGLNQKNGGLKVYERNILLTRENWPAGTAAADALFVCKLMSIK